MLEYDFAVLHSLGLQPASLAALADIPEADHPDARLARVTEVQREGLFLHDGRLDTAARPLPRLVQTLLAEADALVVGDWVIAERNALGETWVSALLPRINQLARRANDGRRQPLASNIDTALLVMGLDHDFNPRRLERYLAFTRIAAVAPVIVLTKSDLADDGAARLDELAARLPGGTPMLAVDARADSAREALAPWLGAGQTVVLLGASGTGKSTLTNTLLATPAQATGAVRAGDSRGRHTTVARHLFRLPGGACLIDTPGLRTWRPDADEAELTSGFDDIQALAAHCRYRDCQHLEEPGCAVRDAVPADRLRNYHKVMRDARQGSLTMRERKAQTAKWKVISKAAKAYGRAKRGG
ncbi:putative ribosome biogenesis GTPase RsgA [Chitiniphilus shinanonensis]|uniref:Small ribosomal subunit biogenesis GTPase RsgA n=1 Tax=Chitiniphilus shinanonensis TaxID=553088 RepID=A0ABQ6BZD2_9NEIS|nr:ribosome small subunit-dependent GTPase A [Chitiniphilus shinanonensis]GLS05891.1 putative ribosome biogenesis GTPase RsgA [Chitiniphilus shinanonensis]